MISRVSDPVRFSSFVDELSDAEGHLHDLIERITEEGDCDESLVRVDLGHIFAHLNRALHMRNTRDTDPDPDWAAVSSFPKDLNPVG